MTNTSHNIAIFQNVARLSSGILACIISLLLSILLLIISR